MDLKNIIAAIALSAAVIVLYGLFFSPTQKEISNLKKNDAGEKINQNDTPSIDEKIVIKTRSREEAINENERIYFENEFIRGSISLLGGEIDDLELKTYDRTLGSKQKIQLLNPSTINNGYTFNTGWATKSNIEIPNSGIAINAAGTKPIIVLIKADEVKAKIISEILSGDTNKLIIFLLHISSKKSIL